jgi:hypothetical protein
MLNEIFVSVIPFSGLSQITVDLLTKKSSFHLAKGCMKKFDNSSMVMRGINNVYGYYLYQFNTGILCCCAENMEEPLYQAMRCSIRPIVGLESWLPAPWILLLAQIGHPL